MGTESDLLLRTNQVLTLTVGTLVIVAVGVACCQYGPPAAKSVYDFYHPDMAQRKKAASDAMMRHVKTTKFEMSDEIREMFETREAEFRAAKQLGEAYRMPPPRRP